MVCNQLIIMILIHVKMIFSKINNSAECKKEQSVANQL